jgi:hypothetical protein
MPFFNSKVMHFLGIPYASPDGMKRAVMSTISNLDTILQVNWFRRTYFPEATSWSEMPPREFGEFLQRTFSGRYGAEAVAIAGYRVTGARMARPLGDIFVAGFRNDFKGTDAEFVAMLRTYGFQESDRVSAGFDIVFDVAPWSP